MSTEPSVPVSVLRAYSLGQHIAKTREPHEVPCDDAPETLAFWDGFYGKPLRDELKGGATLVRVTAAPQSRS